MGVANEAVPVALPALMICATMFSWKASEKYRAMASPGVSCRISTSPAHEDALAGVAEGAIQIDADGDLAAAGCAPDDRQEAGIRVADPARDAVA